MLCCALLSVLLTSAALAGTLGASLAQPPSVQGDGRSVEASSSSGLGRAVVRVEGVDAELFGRALHLRLPGVSLEPFATSAPPRAGERLEVYVHVHPVEGGEAEIVVIASDGRAFFRRLPLELKGNGAEEKGTAERDLANHVASLLTAIAEARVRPDASGERIPIPKEAVGETGEPPDAAESNLDEEKSEVASEPAAKVRPRVPGVDVGLRGVVGWGLGPQQQAPALAGAGAEVQAFWQARSRARLGGGLRYLRSSRKGEGLNRTRVAAGGGYSLVHAERWVFAFDGQFLIEPWWLDGATPLTPKPEQSGADTGPLFGFAAALRPSYSQPLQGTRELWLRIGALVEFQFSGNLSDRLRRIRASSSEEGALFELGGVELNAGLELGLHFDL